MFGSKTYIAQITKKHISFKTSKFNIKYVKYLVLYINAFSNKIRTLPPLSLFYVNQSLTHCNKIIQCFIALAR